MDIGIIYEKLNRIESTLQKLLDQHSTKEYYSTSEVAEFLGKSEFTVREWCRNGRVWACKRETGRGVSKEWMIANEELVRIQNEGLLPRNVI